MNVERAFETVAVPMASLNFTDPGENFIIEIAETQEEVVSQLVDTNGDGQMDELLFQPKMAANSEKNFIVRASDKPVEADSIPACYSRFVPERTDDYAWENDRVAFRTYGPVAQKMVEESIKGGTLSSGIDAWLKRVEYPIINKWYHKELETEGSYHKDDGEGLDNFHVGISRGVGGIAKKVDTTYRISKNFTSWKTLSTGPIRTSFVLNYEDWDAEGTKISEEKKISLDYGSNLSRFEISLKGTDTISAGLTLHDKQGETSVDQEQGWISYWEPHFDSEIGTGIVVPNNAMIGQDKYETSRKDESNLFAHIKSDKGTVIYYAGFAWKKADQFTSKSAWETYLANFAERLANPLEVEIK
ncbi:MAG: DUF4861 domain-containing protein [Maribacter sp.]